MKKKDDPRHIARVKTMQTLFEAAFNNKLKIDRDSDAAKILEKREEIDKLIGTNAPSWPLSQIAPIDSAILRLAIWELNYQTPKEPFRVVVDEAVEIAKEYGTDTAPGFINGVLGAIIKSKSTNDNQQTIN